MSNIIIRKFINAGILCGVINVCQIIFFGDAAKNPSGIFCSSVLGASHPSMGSGTFATPR